MTNGVPEAPLQQHGSKVSGVVQRTGTERQREVTGRQWTVSHLHDEMRYIREVNGHKGSKQPGLRWVYYWGVFCFRSCLHLVCLLAGERLFGEGEGKDVRTVWRNATVDAEAFAGNQGKELRSYVQLPVKACVKL